MTEALTIRRSEASDWYVIERLVHDGHVWIEWSNNGRSGSVRASSRIGNADIEGTAAEMRAIAVAVRDRADVSFRRCAAKTVNDGVLLWSPRNSDSPTLVAYPVALELAKLILAEVPE